MELKTIGGSVVPKEYHKTDDCYDIYSQFDYSSDGCEDIFFKCKFDESGKGVIICLYVDDMLIFGIDQVLVHLTKEFLSSRFSIKGHEGRADVISVSTPIDTSEKLMPNNGILCVILGNSALDKEIQRVLKYLKKTMDYRLMYAGYPFVLEGYIDASWISNTEDNSSTIGWVFLLGDGISCGVKPIAPISIRCDSAATLTKAYSQMYNGKSRHLGVRHNGSLNEWDWLRRLGYKSAEGILVI
ncbi:hypothetical protein Tco_0206036 [Tanacetum coccineum]